MRLSLFACLMVVGFSISPLTRAIAQNIDVPERKPASEAPEKPGSQAEQDEDDDDPAEREGASEDDDDDKQEASENAQFEGVTDEGKDGIPPMPGKAPPLSQRGVKQASEPLGPEAPPETWTEAEITEAKARCEALLNNSRFDFAALEPIRAGVCGAPAPIRLKYMNDAARNDEPRVELRPAGVMTCPLAAALDKWMREVVQPKAKALLHANIVRLSNLSAYQCRTRYGNPTQRMSYHAFAEAVDIGEFLTAKGEHVSVLDHWPATDERSQFLKEIHAGACKIFGTVLGPEANAAHRNHFHFDMAKRRHSAYCQ
jgi:hypothetical protein